ncbi:hypothetical protein T06_336 [Trichinella sp. T6]|nr:hypothetical protein T06_336 [Trichinella sp. T6]
MYKLEFYGWTLKESMVTKTLMLICCTCFRYDTKITFCFVYNHCNEQLLDICINTTLPQKISVACKNLEWLFAVSVLYRTTKGKSNDHTLLHERDALNENLFFIKPCILK